MTNDQQINGSDVESNLVDSILYDIRSGFPHKKSFDKVCTLASYIIIITFIAYFNTSLEAYFTSVFTIKHHFFACFVQGKRPHNATTVNSEEDNVSVTGSPVVIRRRLGVVDNPNKEENLSPGMIIIHRNLSLAAVLLL